MSLDHQPDNVKRAIATVPYFADLDESIVHDIMRRASNRHYAAGEVVLLEGDKVDALYIVYAGWLKAIKASPDGREQVLHHIGAGEVINVVSVFAATANLATVIALEATDLWIIRQTDILDILDAHPELARIVIQRMAGRIEQLSALVADLSLRTLEARLARYLIDHSDNAALQRPRWATQAEMAGRLGTVPDALNRALRNLAKEELIEVSRERIQILDYAGLEARAVFDK